MTGPCFLSVRVPQRCQRCTRSTQVRERNGSRGRRWFGKPQKGKQCWSRKLGCLFWVILLSFVCYIRQLPSALNSALSWQMQVGKHFCLFCFSAFQKRNCIMSWWQSCNIFKVKYTEEWQPHNSDFLPCFSLWIWKRICRRMLFWCSWNFFVFFALL